MLINLICLYVIYIFLFNSLFLYLLKNVFLYYLRMSTRDMNYLHILKLHK